jgi:hypothetical protein
MVTVEAVAENESGSECGTDSAIATQGAED